MLKLYNTLTRKKEIFKPISKNKVGLYSCGPTVYWYQHIGNLRTYIFNDLLKRILIYNGFKVKHVMNYTDVGHLTSDADEGEDKMEIAAKKEHKTAKEIAEHYAKVFEEDCKKLNIISPDIICKATEHIKEQIELIKLLEKKGYTYQTSDGIYYDTSKFKDYTNLGKLSKKGLEAGKRISMGEKKNKTDFALWKFSKKPGIRQQEWDSPWGIGFPGWHIECSAMSSKYLGKQFDIHTGGEDHIQVHHTNEIAQSEAAFEKKPWVKYWLHGAFLTFKGEKVSKSKGGLYTISELEKKGYAPLDYRMFCLTAHYRTQLSFSFKSLDDAKNTVAKLKEFMQRLQEIKNEEKNPDVLKITLNAKLDFENAINDDLDMPQVLATLFNFIKEINKFIASEKISKKDAELVYDQMLKFDSVLGLDLDKIEKIELTQEEKQLIEDREATRAEKDFAKADELRDKLKQKGIILEDTKEGVRWKKL